MAGVTADRDDRSAPGAGSAERAGAGAPAVVGAPFGRRFVAFVVDWVLSALVTYNLLPFDIYTGSGPVPRLVLGLPESSWALLGVFALLNVLLVSLTGSTVGHRLLRLQVWQVRPGTFPLQVLVRTLLACLVLPALVTGGDGRGLHDLAAGTRLVRLPR